MTSTEQAAQRKPTAKEIAEDAAALAQQANSTAQQVLDEVRQLREEGGSTAPAGLSAGVEAKIKQLDDDVDGLVKQLNAFVQKGVTVTGPDGQQVDLDLMVAEFRKAMSVHAAAIDDARKAVGEMQSSASGAAVGKLTELTAEVEELKGWIRTFNEAGVAPATEEDVASLHSRLSSIEQYLQTPPVTAGTAPREALSGVPAVYGQMHQLMIKVGQLGKDGQADEKMGGYAFRSIDAAMDAVGRALREVGMMFVPGPILDHKVKQYEIVKRYNNGGESVQNWTHVWVRQSYRFVSLIDGSIIDGIEMDGEARDNGDKSTSKADSMRYKYALLQALCIPTKGLPESDGRDGTEGADESWENARTREEIEQDKRRQQQAAEPERGHTIEDEPHAPPPGYEQAHPSGGQAPPLVDDRPDEVKAASAVQKLNELSKIDPQQRRDRFQKIADGVRAAGIGSIVVEGSTVNQHLMAANANLGGKG